MTEEEKGEINELPPKYEDLVTEEPEREVDLEEMPKSVTETEEDAPQTSDFKAALKKLRPTFKYPKVNDLIASSMDSRIFPDNMYDKQRLCVLGLIEEHEEEDADIPVIEYIMSTQDALSIGFEGRGIADLLEMYGASREEEMEKLTKELGI